MAEFWENQDVVTRQKKYHVPQFKAPRGTTQGVLESPILFNVVDDGVVYHWLSLTMEDVLGIQDGLGHVVDRRLGVFYADNGLLGSRDLEWLQGALNVLIVLFWRINLAANVVKPKTMTFHMGAILLGMLEEYFVHFRTGEGDT